MAMAQDCSTPDKVRLDKWLWAARFFKTRSQAADAIDGGHVQINGDKPKPARQVRVGDTLRVRNLGGEYEVTVLALAERRGSASVAQTLYAEGEASQARRAAELEAKRLAPQFDHPEAKGRPTKKWRRQIHRFERQQG